MVKPVEKKTPQQETSVNWCRFNGLIDYQQALGGMEQSVGDIQAGRAREQVWLLEHPPLYTGGTSAQKDDLLTPERFPVFETGRGGQYTYHGPGQRICYVMLDLNQRGRDIRHLVSSLEHWVIAALGHWGVTGEIREGRVGVWVKRPDKGEQAEDKIAAIGIRVRRWISFHGLSLNIFPNLEHYAGIVPCGIGAKGETAESSPYGVTSLQDLGITASMDEVDTVLKTTFEEIFAAKGIDSRAPF